MKKRITCILLSIIMLIVVVDPVWATTISDIKKEQQQTQAQLDELNDQIDSVAGELEVVEEEIGEMDSSLVEIIASVSILEDEILEKEDQIVVAQADYEVAKAEEEAQYEAMKLRIKFMYEKGDNGYLQLFLEAQSITDLLTKAEYIEKLYEYDRELLTDYQNIKEDVAALWDTLEDEKSELEATKCEYEEEKAALEVALEEKRAVSENYETQLAKAKQEALAYKTKIKNQTAKIKQLEAAAAAAAAATNKVTKVDASVITNATGSALGKEIATYAIQYVGNPYVPGGTSLTAGADCSGFTYAVYKAFGYKLPRTSTEQRSAGVAVEYSNAQPGDLICYAGHVGLYIGGGMIVHASSVKTGIKISYATYRTILGVRRIV
ncbi:MAG: hydrolase Nlp/P60 [Clostridiales bacterium]|nr:hydrolase Nlp/P60 [Clostridiales bacterium]